MNRDEFNELSTSKKLTHTKENGIKVKSDWVETEFGGKSPRVFRKWPNCFYHFEREESDDEGAVVWIYTEFSPTKTLESISSSDPPIIEVLEE